MDYTLESMKKELSPAEFEVQKAALQEKVGQYSDPLFNNAVDGLMYIKISDLPESTVKPVMEEFQAELERKFMESRQNGDTA